MKEFIKKKSKEFYDDLLLRLREKRLDKEEKSIFEDIQKASSLPEFLFQFKNLGRVPKFENPLTRIQIRKLINNEYVRNELPNLVQKYNDKIRTENETKEKIRREAEEKERNRQYFNFWCYTGEIYGATKYKDRSGDYIYPVTEFFLKMQKGDEHIKLYGYDVPIANGQRSSVIYAMPSNKNKGQAVQYVNFNLNSSTTLTGNRDRIIKGSYESKANIQRFEFELKRYKSGSWLH